MPAWLIVERKNPDGTIDRTCTPYADFGFGSVNSDKEQKDLEQKGYKVKILREKEQKQMEADGRLVRGEVK